MKKFLALLLVLMLAFSCMTAFALGGEPVKDDTKETSASSHKPVEAKLVLGLYPSANFEGNVLDSANKPVPFTARTTGGQIMIRPEPDPAGDGIYKVIVTRQMAIDMYGKGISIMELLVMFPDEVNIYGCELFTYPLFTALVSDPSYDCIEIILNPPTGKKALSCNLYTADGVIPVDFGTAADTFILVKPGE